MQRALTLGLGETLRIDAPFAELGKAEVVRRGAALGVPFALTLSCMNPRLRLGSGGQAHPQHCGACSKCRERHDAFVEAGLADPTDYVDTANVRAS
jgi:7-cyano-7-deazaguanine synthase